MFKDFSACRIVLAANQQNPGNIQRLSPAELSKPQINNILELFKDFSACRIVLAANQHYLRKYSKTFPPAELS